jgi:hypothetical protein
VCGLHAFEDGAYDSADDSRFCGLGGALSGQILLNLVRETRDGERLQPNAARPSERGEKDTVAAEDHVLDAGDALNLECHGRLKGTHVTGMYAEQFAGREVFYDEFAGEFEPRDALAGDFLQAEAVTPKDAGAERLLESDAKFNTRCGAEEAVAVDEVLVPGADFDGDDVTWNTSGEGNFAGHADCSILSHEQRAAAGNTFDGSEETTAAGVLGVRSHLDGGGHPGEFAGLGDDCVIGAKCEFENGHGGAEDAMLHEFLLCATRKVYSTADRRK